MGSVLINGVYNSHCESTLDFKSELKLLTNLLFRFHPSLIKTATHQEIMNPKHKPGTYDSSAKFDT
jgi:hypothetical protein